MKYSKRNGWVVIIIFRNIDYKYFEKARQVSLISDFKKIHIGCIAVYQGHIIGIGCNTNKTHPNQKRYNQYRHIPDDIMVEHKTHAEISCLNSIKDMDIRWQKVRLYIFRSRKDRLYGMSRPCPACMAMIKDMGIRNIYYTSDSGYVYERI